MSTREHTQATETAQALSGMFNPGFSYAVRAYQINRFVKHRGAELLGVIEKADGSTASERGKGEFTQHAGDIVYRFLKNEKAYVGRRYNTVEGEFSGVANKAGADRYALAGSGP